jgi:hypothetical protein
MHPYKKAESDTNMEGALIAAAVAAAVKPPVLPAASLFLKSMDAASVAGAGLAVDQLAATLIVLTSTSLKPFVVTVDGATPDGNDLKAGIGAGGFSFGTASLLSPAVLSMSSGTTFLRSGFLFNGPTATQAITPAPKVTHETSSKPAVSLEGFGELKDEDERINHATINRNIDIDLMPGGPNHCGGDLVFTHLQLQQNKMVGKMPIFCIAPRSIAVFPGADFYPCTAEHDLEKHCLPNCKAHISFAEQTPSPILGQKSFTNQLHTELLALGGKDGSQCWNDAMWIPVRILDFNTKPIPTTQITFKINKEDLFVLKWHRNVLFNVDVGRNDPLVFMTSVAA